MSSASLIGEGFDFPALDALILATPLSFQGRMVQYAGRLHRLVDGKTSAEIIDFVDSCSAMLWKMYQNRLKAYRQMGYVVHADALGVTSYGRKNLQMPTHGLFNGDGLVVD